MNTRYVSLTKIAWGLLVVSGISMMLLDYVVQGIPLVVLSCFALLPIWLLAITWLLLYYRAKLSTWQVWLSMLVSFTVLHIVKGPLLLGPAFLASFVSVLVLTSLYVLPILTFLFLYKHDMGLRVLAWGGVVVIWSLFLWWRTHPDFFIEVLASLSPSAQTTTLSFSVLDIFVPFAFCIAPLCILSFIGHTFRFLYKEFTTG